VNARKARWIAINFWVLAVLTSFLAMRLAGSAAVGRVLRGLGIKGLL